MMARASRRKSSPRPSTTSTSGRGGAMAAVLTLIEGGDVYAPEALGARSLLLAGSRVMRIAQPGEIDRRTVANLDPEARVIDASKCFIIPGLVDPHAHLIGAGGEQGFVSRMPEMTWDHIALAGVT